MRPNKTGQVAKFHSPLPDENPNQLYVVLEIMEDNERPRALIRALNTGLGSFTPINTVLLNDLEITHVHTHDLMGQSVAIQTSDSSRVIGKVISIAEQNILLDLSKSVGGTKTNVWLKIQDEKGIHHTGTLFVN